MTRDAHGRQSWSGPPDDRPGAGPDAVPDTGGTVTMTGPDQVTVASGGRPVAQADVVPGPQVVVRFWVTAHALTPANRAELVRAAFAHASLGPEQRVLASVPHEDSHLIAEVRNRVTVTHSHVAGATCLLEGRVA